MSSIYRIDPGKNGSISVARVWSDADGPALPAQYSSLLVHPAHPSTLLAYESASGRTDTYALAADKPWIGKGDAKLDLPAPSTGDKDAGGWDMLRGFVLGNAAYILAYRQHDGTFSFFPLTGDLKATLPFTKAMPRNTPTPGFTTVAPFDALGSQYVLGYDTNTGTVGIYSLAVQTKTDDGSPSLNFLNVWYHQWAKFWTAFSFFQFGGSNFFFKINKGVKPADVNIDHIQDDPSKGTVEIGTKLGSILPEAADITIAMPVDLGDAHSHFVTYAPSGKCTFHVVHADCKGWDSSDPATIEGAATAVVPYRLKDTSFMLVYTGSPDVSK